MATRVIDDSKLQDIAVAIQGKDGGGTMTVDQMPGRIEAIPSGAPVVSNPALVLWDWEGTKLVEYSAEDALALIELPAPSTLPAYATADHELLLFQEWNWSLADIKTWIQNHKGGCLDVGAIYTTTDGRNYNYWGNPRLSTPATITMYKCGTASIGGGVFQNRYSLTAINIPDEVTSIGSSAFQNCYSLTAINIPDGVTSIGGNAFQSCRELYDVVIHGKPALSNTNAFSNAPSTQKLYVHRSDLSWYETATNWSTLYAQGKIVAAADYLDHLISIGIDVTDFENEVISE